MSEAAIRAKIKSTLEGVSGIGQVYDWNRYSRSLAKLLALLRDASGNLLGWEITRRSVSQVRGTMPSLYRHHTYAIHGIMSVDDASASEKTLQALVDDIMDAFKNDPTLGGVCMNSDPLQVVTIDYEDINGTLYHVIELRLTAIERVAYSA